MTLPKLALIPSGYKASKVYSALPTNGDGDFAFSRSGTATRVNKDGLIETVDSNVPRLDYLDSNCPSLLLEPQRRNLVLYSEAFTGTNWYSTNTTLTPNTIISPSGELNGNKLERTSTSGSYRVHRISKAASAITYTTSIFIKKGSDNYFSMRAQGSYPNRVDIKFRFDTEEIYDVNAVSPFVLLDYGVKKHLNGWYRIHFTYTTDTYTYLQNLFITRATNGNTDSPDTSNSSYAYVWGLQVEEGSYASSYIPTGGSTVTRIKEFINDAGNAQLFNSLEGTFFLEMASFLNTQTNNNGIELADSNSQNRITIQYDTINNQIRADIRVANVQQSFMTSRAFDVTNFNKIALTYKLNEVKLYINSILIDTDTSVNIFPENTLTEIKSTIANISNGDFYLQAKIKDIRVYNTALTEAEAIALTTL